MGVSATMTVALALRMVMRATLVGPAAHVGGAIHLPCGDSVQYWY